MATMILLPDGVTGTNNWSYSGGSSYHDSVDEDDASSYVKENTDNAQITFTMANPSVAESAIDSITSVQIIAKSVYTALSGTMTWRAYQTGPGILNGNDNFSTPSGPVAGTNTGTAREDAALSGWSYTNLENLRIKLLTTMSAAKFASLRVGYLYALVTYEEAADGYGNSVMGVASGDIAKINGIATANISKVNGV